MDKCHECGMPRIEPTEKLPCVLIVRLTKGNLAELLRRGRRTGRQPEWIAREMIWKGLA